MINSQYILDIFDIAFDDHSASDLLRKQIPYLKIRDKEHTGIGVFIYFSSDNLIQQFKLDTSNATNFDINGNPTDIVDGVEITSPDHSILADATVHLKCGIIDSLEIWNKCGKDYLQTDPEHYQLGQMWLDENKKRTIVR
jgi:hypothetical protein